MTMTPERLAEIEAAAQRGNAPTILELIAEVRALQAQLADAEAISEGLRKAFTLASDEIGELEREVLESNSALERMRAALERIEKKGRQYTCDEPTDSTRVLEHEPGRNWLIHTECGRIAHEALAAAPGKERRDG